MSLSDDRVGKAYEPPRKDPDGERARPDNELAYFPEAPRATSSTGAVYNLLAPAFALMAFGGVFESLAIGAAAGSAVIGYQWWRRKRQRTVPRALLKIEGEQLRLSGAAFPGGGPLVFHLSELLDVYLDTKTIQRVRENPGPLPELRFINATVGGEQDTARIALELEHETFFLTQERLSHTDANEWFSKIRRFLRRHGWVPEDERAA